LAGEDDPRFVYALEFWRRAGFNMKIFIRTGVGLFVGTEVALDEYGPTGEYVPEISRTFQKAGISCSSSAKKSVKEGAAGDGQLDNLRSCLALAKAYDFAGIVPSISRKYLSCAQSLAEMDHELQMRTGEDSVDGILEAIHDANAIISPEQENALLVKFGRSITQAERDVFEAYSWQCDMKATTSYGEFYNSLPLKWQE